MNQPQKIVIVDDDEMTLELMRIGLEARHFTVYTAVDSMDGIKKIQESKPDLIILDIMLPDLSGIELLSLIQYGNCLEQAPVILMSGLNDVKVSHAADKLGAVGYLVKPFDMDVLMEKIATLPGFQPLPA